MMNKTTEFTQKGTGALTKYLALPSLLSKIDLTSLTLGVKCITKELDGAKMSVSVKLQCSWS